MQAQVEEAARAEALPLARVAAVELQLQDARRDLQELVDERSELFRRADVASALACDPDQPTIQRNTEATRHRLSAFLLSGQIDSLTKRIARLESALKSAPTQAAAVALSRDQIEGMDDMAGALA